MVCAGLPTSKKIASLEMLISSEKVYLLVCASLLRYQCSNIDYLLDPLAFQIQLTNSA